MVCLPEQLLSAKTLHTADLISRSTITFFVSLPMRLYVFPDLFVHSVLTYKLLIFVDCGEKMSDQSLGRLSIDRRKKKKSIKEGCIKKGLHCHTCTYIICLMYSIANCTCTPSSSPSSSPSYPYRSFNSSGEPFVAERQNRFLIVYRT